MKDFYGTEIEIGDEVAFVKKEYREIQKGVITSIARKKVSIKPEDGEDTLRFPENVIVQIGGMPELAINAHWLYDAVDSDGTGDYFCSVCNRNAAVKYTYCPHCGARMDGEGEQ